MESHSRTQLGKWLLDMGRWEGPRISAVRMYLCVHVEPWCVIFDCHVLLGYQEVVIGLVILGHWPVEASLAPDNELIVE